MQTQLTEHKKSSLVINPSKKKESKATKGSLHHPTAYWWKIPDRPKKEDFKMY